MILKNSWGAKGAGPQGPLDPLEMTVLVTELLWTLSLTWELPWAMEAAAAAAADAMIWLLFVMDAEPPESPAPFLLVDESCLEKT